MHSIWYGLNDTRYTNCTHSLQDMYEICIIGGGLCGLYSAVLLAQQGHEVILFEAASTIGQGATSLSTGKLTIQHGTMLQKLHEDVRLPYVQANQHAIEQIRQLLPAHYFTERNAIVYSEQQDDSIALKTEYSIYEQLRLPTFATNETELPFAIDLAIAIKEQYEIDPYAVQLALVELAKKHGATICTEHRVTHIDHSKSTLTVNEQVVQFKQLIIATHYPIDAITSLQIMKLTNSRSYLCAAEILEPFSSYYISNAQQSRTIRTATINEQHYLIYGGTSHLAGTVSKSQHYYKTLQQELTTHFDLHETSYSWSNQDVQTFDALPVIGPITDNIFIATGFNKWGLSQSLVAANMLAAFIDNTPHALAPYVSPKRMQPMQMLQTAGFTIAQFLNGYVNRLAAPTCTHLGCKTRWNDADETWDCPCHGSRFNKAGQVIEGPAVQPLQLREKE